MTFRLMCYFRLYPGMPPFQEDYKVPLIPPELAAYLAVSIELTAPVLLVVGLATHPVALVLLGMTTVIEVFVYPQAWPTHIQWVAMLLVLLTRGPGKYSIADGSLALSDTLFLASAVPLGRTRCRRAHDDAHTYCGRCAAAGLGKRGDRYSRPPEGRLLT
ncbi:hypothetical protein CF70_029395 [Cupriavidus sp. SK-3]|nr:hypothetical protein CF70_029395 [Cupriavidus sp. SK-3]